MSLTKEYYDEYHRDGTKRTIKSIREQMFSEEEDCGSRSTRNSNSLKRLHIDHWLPLVDGHILSMTNAVLMCGCCNNSKSSKLPT